MVKSNLEKQFTPKRSDAWVLISAFLIVVGCILAVLVALTIKLIQWLFS